MLNWNDYVQMLTAFVVIVNPLGAIPIFIGLTADQSKSQRRNAAHIAAVAVAIILAAAALLGQSILAFFNISVSAFRIAGGILLLLMSVNMLYARHSTARHSPEEAKEAETKENLAVVPLAIPLMAGPAAISTVIIYAHKTHGWIDTLLLLVTCLLTALIVWVALRAATPLSRLLGRTGINVAVRVMGLLLAAISISFITEGLGEVFPQLIK